jgi:hypothetical protein
MHALIYIFSMLRNNLSLHGHSPTPSPWWSVAREKKEVFPVTLYQGQRK